jgi:hypothetical protein
LYYVIRKSVRRDKRYVIYEEREEEMREKGRLERRGSEKEEIYRKTWWMAERLETLTAKQVAWV